MNGHELLFFKLIALLFIVQTGGTFQRSHHEVRQERFDSTLSRGTTHRNLGVASRRVKKPKSEKGTTKRGPKASVKNSKGKGGKGKGISKGDRNESGRSISFYSPSPTAQPTCLECDDIPFDRRQTFFPIIDASARSVQRLVSFIIIVGLIFLFCNFWHRWYRGFQELQENGKNVHQAQWSDEKTEAESHCDEVEWAEDPYDGFYQQRSF